MKKYYLITLLMAAARIAYGFDPFEIQVYDSSSNKPGEASLEMHINHFASGRALEDELSADKRSHITFEFAYGVTPWWELGFYAQSAITPEPAGHWAGNKLRSKFVVPNQDFWELGANFEVAYIPTDFEEGPWGAEIRPIFGVHFAKWRFLTNPILEFNLSSSSKAKPDFSPAFKSTYQVHKHAALGLEYFLGYGAIDQIHISRVETQYLFVVTDLVDVPFEFNFGLGAGMTDQSSPLIAKTIVGFDF